jgi:tetratricopeptide (TPR) repeat protein
MALVAHSAAQGADSHAWRLAAAQSCSLMLRSRYQDDTRQGHMALAAAERLGDPVALAHAHFQIGRTRTYHVNHETARFHLEHALQLYRALGDEQGMAETHRTLTECLAWLGEFEAGLDHAQAYLAAARRLGHDRSTAQALNVVGRSLQDLGRCSEALTTLESALALARALDFHRLVANVLQALGDVHHKLGDQAASYECFLSAAESDPAFWRADLNDDMALAAALASLGDAIKAREIWERVSRESDVDAWNANRAAAKLAELAESETDAGATAA